MTYKKQNEKANDPITASQERVVEMYARLVQGQGFKRADLEEEFNVSTRTAQRDVNAIKNAVDNSSAKTGEFQYLEFDRKEKVYKLDPPVRKLLSKSEAFAVIKVLLESRGFNPGEMKHLIDKLIECCIAPSEKYDFKNQINREFTNYIGPQHGKDVIESVWELEEAVHKHYPIKIDYSSKHKTNFNITLLPIAIMYSEYYFYLLAYKKSVIEDKMPLDKRFPYVYRIDRILGKKIYKNKNFKIENISAFTENEIRKRVHFMFGGPLNKIKFYCANESVEAALDRLPTAKKISKDDKRTLLEAEVYGSGVDMWIRSQGDWVEVVKE